jgi:hypothetical protein
MGPKYQGSETSGGNRYEVYSASSRSEALSFLRGKEVKEERLYVIVETPEGNFGRDLIWIFDEKTQELLEHGERKPLPQIEKSMTRCARCGYIVLPVGAQAPKGPIDVDEVGELLKEKGMGFYCGSCQTLWCPFCVSTRGFSPTCELCGEEVDFFRDDL